MKLDKKKRCFIIKNNFKFICLLKSLFSKTCQLVLKLAGLSIYDELVRIEKSNCQLWKLLEFLLLLKLLLLLNLSVRYASLKLYTFHFYLCLQPRNMLQDMK